MSKKRGKKKKSSKEKSHQYVKEQWGRLGGGEGGEEEIESSKDKYKRSSFQFLRSK